MNAILRWGGSLCSCRFASSSPRVAVIGSGPAGLFTCGSLLRRSNVSVDVFDASPVPFGLVRYGVAPDHQEVKNCIHGFEKMFESNRERLNLYCNVRIGTDLVFDELLQLYDGILLAYGAHKPRRLSIPGSNAKNVFSGSDFVSWYNGVPHAASPDLSHSKVVIIGNGNVALDCARVLSTGSLQHSTLRSSDVPAEYLDCLEQSNIRDIKILGRRGPQNISFTVKELREQFKVSDWNSTVEMSDADYEDITKSLETMDRRRKRLMQVLLNGVGTRSEDRNCRFIFHRVPREIFVNSDGSIAGLRALNAVSKKDEDFECGLLIYSIGYETIVLEGVPKNAKGMIDMEDQCRVRMPSALNRARVYAAGWCAHGPKGVIVDTQQQATFVAEQMAMDLQHSVVKESDVEDLLRSRDVDFISWEDWKNIDAEERRSGLQKGKVREKVTHFEKFIRRK